MAKRNNKGFTLIELMVSVAIIGTIAVAITPNLFHRSIKAKIAVAKQDISVLRLQLELYRLDNNNYPTTQQGLQALVVQPSNTPNWESGGYIKNLPNDPFGNAYIYNNSNGNIDVYSKGADGVIGGTGDNSDIH